MSPAQDPLSPALERVLLRYAAMVHAAARRHGVPDSDIDEVFQEVRIRLWKALGSGERIAEANTSYVYQTAMSAACDVVRRHRETRNESLDAIPDHTRAGAGSVPGPDVALDRRELGREIERGLASLGPAQRPVVRMYLAGYPQAQIEAVLGWTEAKTRNVLYRGLGELRKALARQGLEPGVAR
jgi:RNA polymerase sigma-70 factor (ECF subfamily)